MSTINTDFITTYIKKDAVKHSLYYDLGIQCSPVQQSSNASYTADAFANTQIGYSVALSSDGIYLAYGVPYYSYSMGGVTYTSCGSVYVFKRLYNNWVQKAKILAQIPSNLDSRALSENLSGNAVQMGVGIIYDLCSSALFGYSIHISDDGYYIAVGSPFAKTGLNQLQNSSTGNATGAVYIYKRTNDNWTAQAKLFINDAINAPIVIGHSGLHFEFGNDVTINATGQNLLVSCRSDRFGKSDSGMVVSYTRNKIVWTKRQELIPYTTIGADDTQAGALFGSSISISADGRYLIVGAKNYNTNYGAAYIYYFLNNNWSIQAKLTAIVSDTSARNFGNSVSMSADGTHVAIGCPVNDNGGSVYVFDRAYTTWTVVDPIISKRTIAVDAQFGSDVDISSNGIYIAIGAPNDTPNVSIGESGAVYLFKRVANIWFQLQVISHFNSSGQANQYQDELYGAAVSLSSNGRQLAIGSPQYPLGSSDRSGAVIVYYADAYHTFRMTGVSDLTERTLTLPTLTCSPTTNFLLINLTLNLTITLPFNNVDGRILHLRVLWDGVHTLSLSPLPIGWTNGISSGRGITYPTVNRDPNITLIYSMYLNNWYRVN
jgi:hypothetical protein